MRTFISIDIPKEVKEKIKKIQDKLPEFKGKKTETENLHLTLKFLGEIDEEKIEEIKKKLREIECDSFETKIDSIGIFSEKFIKIIWLHLTNCEKLQKEIDEKLKGLFEKEKRFMSHLTIARVKNVKEKKKFLEKVKEIEIPLMVSRPIRNLAQNQGRQEVSRNRSPTLRRLRRLYFVVDNFRLKKSVLTEKGPEYKDIEVYKLGKYN